MKKIEWNSVRFAFSPFPLIVVKRGLMAEHVMVMLREAVGFVADVLQQPQAVGVAAEAARRIASAARKWAAEEWRIVQ